MANTKIPSVLWNVDQTEVLSSDNKTQARANIDAASTGAVETVQTNLNNHKHKVQFNRESAIELTCNNNTATSLNHSHGNITTDGKVTDNAIEIGNKDTLLIVDYSDNNIVKKTTLEFDGSTTTEALTKAGTWASFNNYEHPAGSAASQTGVPTGDVPLKFGDSFKVNQISTDSTSHVSAVTERTITMPSLGTTSTTAAAGDHGHGAITTDGKIGTAADKLVVTGTDGALTTGGTASDLVHDSNYVHTDNNFTNTLKTKLDTIASGAEVNVQSNWNETNTSSDAYILNKPAITTVQKVSGATTNNLKTLKISTSDQSVSGILQDDSSVPLGYVAPLTDDALPGSVLRLDGSKYLEWSFATAIPDPPQDSSSQYKLLTLDYQGNNLVPKWTTWTQATEPRELRPVSSNIQLPFTSTSNILADGDTPIYVKDLTRGNYDYYSLGHQQASSYYEYYQLSLNGNNANVNFITVNSDETVTSKPVKLQGKLTAGSGISISSDNTIMCTGTGQVVDGIYKNQTSGSTNATIQCLIDNTNTPTVELIRSDVGKATYLNHQYVRSYEITPYADNTYTMFAVNPSNTTQSDSSGTNSFYTRQLPTALGSVYSSVESLSRATLLGSDTRSFGEANLGYLTAGSMSLRLINASATSTSNPLMPSCIPGELNFIKFGSKGQTLYFKHYTDGAWHDFDEYGSYISCDVRDGMLALTTNARTITNRSAAQGAELTNSGLGHMTFFPSTYYVHNYVENYVRNVIPERVGMDLLPGCRTTSHPNDGNSYARMVDINIPANANEHTISLGTYVPVKDWPTGALMFFFIRESVKTNSGDSGSAINKLEKVTVEVDSYLAEQYGPFPALTNNTFMMFHIGRDSNQPVSSHPITMAFQVLPNSYTTTGYAATTFKATIIVLPLGLV